MPEVTLDLTVATTLEPVQGLYPSSSTYPSSTTFPQAAIGLQTAIPTEATEILSALSEGSQTLTVVEET